MICLARTTVIVALKCLQRNYIILIKRSLCLRYIVSMQSNYCMCAFIYILAFLFAFQPASWAMLDSEIAVPLELEHSSTKPFENTKEGTQSKSASTHGFAGSQHDCAYTISLSSEVATYCVEQCPADCYSATGLTLNIPELLKNRAYASCPPICILIASYH